MKDILCIYYSRTGNTRRAMEEIGQALDAEVVELHDGVERGGWQGWLRSGLDAVRRDPPPLEAFETAQPLEAYRLVIVGTPVWAGRCSAVTRAFLKAYGKKLQAVAYLVTRGSDGKFEEIYRQMDGYTARPHRVAVSLRPGSVGYAFWQEDFLRQVRDALAQAE
jgi:hypothetical protein